ncbi:MAG: DNA polymerase III subunit alpha [Bacteroidales bacterium]|jgi:DNA polymerase-3 subunit alpha|nr:DNA polymerase III subunit alpha [Bacteroidales bacterium]
MFIIFDTETTGLPKDYNAPLSDSDNWPRLVQLAWQIHDDSGEFISAHNEIVRPEGFIIPFQASKVHGISTEKALEIGKPLNEVLALFSEHLAHCTHIAGHNIEFDLCIMGAEFYRKSITSPFEKKIVVDTMKLSVDFCQIPSGRGGKFKFPKLAELHTKLFNESFDEAHNASADVLATARCFFELIRLNVITANNLQIDTAWVQAFQKAHLTPIAPAEIEIQSNFAQSEEAQNSAPIIDTKPDVTASLNIPEEERKFVHLHVHTQYSLLDGAASISSLVEKAINDGMPALAITDHGNMYGVKEFYNTCKKKGIKPILGCEAYVVNSYDVFADGNKDKSNHHLVLLAKNHKGYQNLMKLISIANVEGMYYKPRICKADLEKYKEGLIVTSACLGGEVARMLQEYSVEAAEKVIQYYHSLFGDDYYLEVMLHPAKAAKERHEVYDSEVFVNNHLLEIGKKLGIQVVATNDVHFTNASDAEAQDILLCLSTSADYTAPDRMRFTREEWFKTTDEMYELWGEHPEVLQNTLEIANKIEMYELDSAPIMPEFPIPEEFGTIEAYQERFLEDDLKAEFKRYDKLGTYKEVLRIKFEADYLIHLTNRGAEKRYGKDMKPEIRERIDFELNTIKQMGFPGYFLIVQDFIAEARNMGVLVGPGRGSAAGSAVAYCLGITNIDPIPYDLLFERFLNPDRISMPDIDIDFDDDGRQRVIDWVVEKYGHDKVAHICTFGTMAAKSAIKDVARVLKLPLQEANRITKEFPENGKLNGAYAKVLAFEQEYGSLDKAIAHIETAKKEAAKADNTKAVTNCEVQLFFANEIAIARKEQNEIELKTLENACVLEGSVRQTGVHACGILIGKNSLCENIPIATNKVDTLLSTQYEGTHIEPIGLLKMDFLGLRTLTIIRDALVNIKLSKNIDIDIDAIPLTDSKTFELFGKGETSGVFQFESPGMKKHLRALRPNRFEDLVAMNALYRPGPMAYIPDYIARKNGEQKVEFDHPLMEKYLGDTYGITVFQEQVMLLSRELAGFTRGDSDVLRKAMGKKQIEVMNKLKKQFSEGCLNNEQFTSACTQINKNAEELINKIWTDWEAFASYAFNKSHSVCYAYVAYQTAYLKANYPAEFMAATLSSNISNATEISKYMEECARMKLEVLVPDVNESQNRFSVNKQGQIRFGLGAIKGFGEAASQSIIEEQKNGAFKDVFDFVARVSLRTVNKKNIENLILAGAFDSFKIERHRFFPALENETSFIETLLKYGTALQSKPETNMMSLFGDEEIAIEKPQIPTPPAWNTMKLLQNEKELIGIYLSAHPLDEFKLLINHFCKTSLAELAEISNFYDRELTVAGMITKSQILPTKTGKEYMRFTLDDFNGSYEFTMFGKDFEEFSPNIVLNEKIALTLKAEKNKWRENADYEYKIKKIEPLEDLNKRVKFITLSFDVNKLTDTLVTEIYDLCNVENIGFPINVEMYDKHTSVQVKMKSKNLYIDLTADCVEYMQGNNVHFKLN